MPNGFYSSSLRKIVSLKVIQTYFRIKKLFHNFRGNIIFNFEYFRHFRVCLFLWWLESELSFHNWSWKRDDFSLSINLNVCLCQGFEIRWISVELNQLLFFHKFYDFFCWGHFLMNRPFYNNLFQFMQHCSFRNLNKVIFTHWKHLESRINAIWYWIFQ